MDIPTLIAALIIVESGGNPQAVGDHGMAVGILQIHPVFVEDVNRILGREVYTLADRNNSELSIEMVKTWLVYYKGRWEDRYTGEPSYKDMALIFNRGYHGYKVMVDQPDWKLMEQPYWEKVKAVFEANGWEITP